MTAARLYSFRSPRSLYQMTCCRLGLSARATSILACLLELRRLEAIASKNHNMTWIPLKRISLGHVNIKASPATYGPSPQNQGYGVNSRPPEYAYLLDWLIYPIFNTTAMVTSEHPRI